MTPPPEILNWLAIILLAGIGIVLTVVLKHFTKKHLEKSDNMLLKISDVEKKHDTLNLTLVQLNLPEVKRRAERAYSDSRPVSDLEELFSRHEKWRQDDRELIIQLNESVKSTQIQLELINKNNEEHFALVENAFAAKVAEIVQLHLSQFREDNRREFVGINKKLDTSNQRYYDLERRVAELEMNHKRCKYYANQT